MTLLALDTDNCWHVLETEDVKYDPDDRTLTICTFSGTEYDVEEIDRYSAEDLIRTLFASGRAELPMSFRIE